MKTIEYSTSDVIIATIGIDENASSQYVRATVSALRRQLKRGFNNNVIVIPQLGLKGVDLTFARNV